MFRENDINLGNVSVGKKVIVKFKAIDKLPEIHSLVSSCGCSTPSFDKRNNEVVISYIPMNIPHHLSHLNEYSTAKKIIVTYVNGGQDILIFNSTVKR